MKVTTIINKIKKENACSIATAELLTKAAYRENKLSSCEAIRFRPFFCDFDIVNSNYENGLITQYKYIGEIKDLEDFLNGKV